MLWSDWPPTNKNKWKKKKKSYVPGLYAAKIIRGKKKEERRGLVEWGFRILDTLKVLSLLPTNQSLTAAQIYLSQTNWYVQEVLWLSGLNRPVAWISPHLLWNHLPQVSLTAFQFYKLTKISTEQSVCQGWIALLQQGQLMGVGQQHVSEQGWIVQALRRWGYFSRSWVGLLYSWWLALPGVWRARHSYATEVYSG